MNPAFTRSLLHELIAKLDEATRVVDALAGDELAGGFARRWTDRLVDLRAEASQLRGGLARPMVR